MHQPLRIAVLASGRGSNLAALIAARDGGTTPFEIACVGSDKPSAPALALAREAGIAAFSLDPRQYSDRASFDRAMFDRLAEANVDLVVLAGYMRVIDAAALTPWVGKLINVHPSLLPKYRGLHTHRRALAAGDAEHGASVHLVTAELDGGPVIAQVRLPILPGDDEQRLANRLLPLEHRLLTSVVQAFAAGRLHWDGVALRLDDALLREPLRPAGDSTPALATP